MLRLGNLFALGVASHADKVFLAWAQIRCEQERIHIFGKLDLETGEHKKSGLSEGSIERKQELKRMKTRERRDDINNQRERERR